MLILPKRFKDQDTITYPTTGGLSQLAQAQAYGNQFTGSRSELNDRFNRQGCCLDMHQGV